LTFGLFVQVLQAINKTQTTQFAMRSMLFRSVMTTRSKGEHLLILKHRFNANKQLNTYKKAMQSIMVFI